tara:strand:+ start:9198 stop:9650 length:453 start_codon:yes stop_codon:yes gene_type:complete
MTRPGRYGYALAITIGLLAGSGSAAAAGKAIFAFDPEKLHAIPVLTLCQDLFLFRTAPAQNGNLGDWAQNQLEDSLVAQAVTEKQDLLLAREGRLRLGMSRCALLAVKGSAAFTTTTQTGDDLRIKYRYADGSTVLTYQHRVIDWGRDAP